jgi:hypothetical protein
LYDLSRNEEAAHYVQNLLNDAFGDQNAEQHSKDLMNFDAQKDRYIWFEYENDNPQNLYHAYHLAIPKTHDEEKNAIERMPKRAKRFIDLKRNK